MLKRIIVTGANGVGKSHFAGRIASVRPDLPVISFDAIKLKTNWEQKTPAEITANLAKEIAKPRWILEGGPSLLAWAINEADALIWLDPPEYVRTWQLFLRPLKFAGKTRPELPAGNVDRPLQQYRFAVRSLSKRRKFRRHISEFFDDTYERSDGVQKWRCRNRVDQIHVLAELGEQVH